MLFLVCQVFKMNRSFQWWETEPPPSPLKENILVSKIVFFISQLLYRKYRRLIADLFLLESQVYELWVSKFPTQLWVLLARNCEIVPLRANEFNCAPIRNNCALRALNATDIYLLSIDKDILGITRHFSSWKINVQRCLRYSYYID